ASRRRSWDSVGQQEVRLPCLELAVRLKDVCTLHIGSDGRTTGGADVVLDRLSRGICDRNRRVHGALHVYNRIESRALDRLTIDQRKIVVRPWISQHVAQLNSDAPDAAMRPHENHAICVSVTRKPASPS